MPNSYTNFKIANLDYLLELSRGDEEFVKEMIKTFLVENPEEIHNLEKSILKKDYLDIQQTSHKLRSTLPFVGLDKLIEKDVLELEKLAANRSDIQKIKSLFAKIKETCLKAIKELENSFIVLNQHIYSEE